MLEYKSIAALAEAASSAGKTISEIVLADQAASLEESEAAVYEKMQANFEVMGQAAAKGAASSSRSASGLSGGDGLLFAKYAEGSPLCGKFCALAVSKALAIAEYNAAMGRIVAAPTAGSCGILPAALLTMVETQKIGEEAAVMSLFTAGAVGMVIAGEACIAGAEGGCQAECGSAAAMTAAALVEASGGSPASCADAAAMALKCQLGLVCDPVAGLVEAPCVKRNAAGVMLAFTAADMALAGIKSVIPVDEVIQAMREVGDSMPASLRETGLGGLAGSATGQALRQRIFG